MEDYEKLLDSALKDMPASSVNVTRTEIPKATGRVEGNKTIITNFNQLVKFFNRDPQHFLKFLLRELASPGKLEENRLIIGRKLNPTFINQKVAEYAEIYVLCPECKKPDTKLIEENGKLYLKCTACGARNIVKEKV
ncbi:MAG: translation initiation factor IF-2 subunit beta [Candidatus Nanoarchaeia archaeon]